MDYDIDSVTGAVIKIVGSQSYKSSNDSGAPVRAGSSAYFLLFCFIRLAFGCPDNVWMSDRSDVRKSGRRDV